MDLSEQYREKILSHLDEIRSSGKPVFVFGAGRAGWYIMKVLEHHGVAIEAFADGDPSKQGSYHGYRVLPPGKIVNQFSDANVFLGIFLPDTAAEVQRQLEEFGFQHIHYSTAAFLFMYFVTVAKRTSDLKVLARSIHILFENYKEGPIHYGHTRDNCFVSPYVTSAITQKCTLRCRDCAQLMPYYETPVHFSAESVIDDLRQYAKAFDVVPEISLQGGEPFLHPEIDIICREAADIPNIVFVSFVTNGTILPSQKVMEQLSASGADVHQSGGYGSLSRKQDELFDAFGRHNIYSDIMFCSPTHMWTRSAACRKHLRPSAENNKLYKECIASKTCCQIMDGELHRCALSMHGSHQGLFPKYGDDFVRLHEPDMPGSILTAKIRELLTRDHALNVCDYCDPHGGTLVPPAIQLSRTEGNSCLP